MSKLGKEKSENMACSGCSGDVYKLIAVSHKRTNKVSLVAECVGCGKQDTLLTSVKS